jgi:hypothetical protein
MNTLTNEAEERWEFKGTDWDVVHFHGDVDKLQFETLPTPGESCYIEAEPVRMPKLAEDQIWELRRLFRL